MDRLEQIEVRKKDRQRPWNEWTENTILHVQSDIPWLVAELEKAKEDNECYEAMKEGVETRISDLRVELKKAKENDTLSRSMLAKQCDLARNAESELEKVKAERDMVLRELVIKTGCSVSAEERIKERMGEMLHQLIQRK